MKYYRIKQIGENQFIPQVANSLFKRIFGHWLGIDKKEYYYTWYSQTHQERYCIHNSWIDAISTIEKHKNDFTKDSFKFRTKYYKV